MAIVKQSTEKPLPGEMRKINGIAKEWTGTRWVAIQQVVKQKYIKKKAA